MQKKIKFRTHNKEFLSQLKKRIIENSNSSDAWRCVYNQLYLDDMGEYLRSISSSTVVCGSGSYIPKVIFISPDGTDAQMQQIKSVIRNYKVNSNHIWITPRVKSSDIPVNVQEQYLVLEIKMLSPELVIDLSNSNIQNEVTKLGIKYHKVSLNEIGKAVELAISCCKMM